MASCVCDDDDGDECVKMVRLVYLMSFAIADWPLSHLL